MAVTLACEAQWLSHAAVARPASAYYAGQYDPEGFIDVDFLAMSYMLVFIVACLPATWVIERWGLGVGVGAGAVLTIAGSAGKGIWAASFAAQVGFQLLLALAQPFLTNGVTTMAREWFPVRERATAGGLASLSQYLGFVAALVVAPALVQADPELPDYGDGMDRALAVFGGFGVLAGLAALVVVRRGPNRATGQRITFRASLRQLLTYRDFRITLVLFLLGLGILNAVTAMTDAIAASLGVRDSDGLLGVGLIAGGVIGAVLLPLASDRAQRRKPFLILGMGLAVPALGLLALAPGGAYGAAIAAMSVLGFALMSAGPIGFQYAAEVTAPVPESASQGVLLLAGQVSGLVFTAGMSAAGAAGAGAWLLGFTALSVLMLLGATRLAESPLMLR